MAPKTITLTVSNEDHTIPLLGHRRSKGWRKEFEKLLSALAPKLSAIEPELLRVDLADTAQLQVLLSSVFVLVEDALDMALALIVAYDSDGVMGSKETVEEGIYDEEIINNFIVVLRAAVPFDQLVGLFKTLTATNGPTPTTTGTSSSLPGPSGE